jgi:hypothetical protein
VWKQYKQLFSEPLSKNAGPIHWQVCFIQYFINVKWHHYSRYIYIY